MLCGKKLYLHLHISNIIFNIAHALHNKVEVNNIQHNQLFVAGFFVTGAGIVVEKRKIKTKDIDGKSKIIIE